MKVKLIIKESYSVKMLEKEVEYLEASYNRETKDLEINNLLAETKLVLDMKMYEFSKYLKQDKITMEISPLEYNNPILKVYEVLEIF